MTGIQTSRPVAARPAAAPEPPNGISADLYPNVLVALRTQLPLGPRAGSTLGDVPTQGLPGDGDDVEQWIDESRRGAIWTPFFNEPTWDDAEQGIEFVRAQGTRYYTQSGLDSGLRTLLAPLHTDAPSAIFTRFKLASTPASNANGDVYSIWDCSNNAQGSRIAIGSSQIIWRTYTSQGGSNVREEILHTWTPDTDWHDLAIIRDTTTTMYLDGASVGTTTRLDNTGASDNASTAPVIGSSNTGGEHFDGHLAGLAALDIVADLDFWTAWLTP